ncbi:unnamed protein product, partial [marine sediment metagenome]
TNIMIDTLSPKEAEQRFLDRFNFLFTKKEKQKNLNQTSVWGY